MSTNPMFPATIPGWTSAFPSLLTICAADNLPRRDPIAPPDPQNQSFLLNHRAVALMAFEFYCRCWVSELDYSSLNPQSLYSHHFAFFDLGIRSKNQEPSQVQWWAVSPAFSPNAARYYLIYTPPRGPVYPGVQSLQPQRPASIYVDAMRGVMPYVTALIDTAREMMGSETFEGERAPWLSELKKRYPGVYS